MSEIKRRPAGQRPPQAQPPVEAPRARKEPARSSRELDAQLRAQLPRQARPAAMAQHGFGFDAFKEQFGPGRIRPSDLDAPPPRKTTPIRPGAEMPPKMVVQPQEQQIEFRLPHFGQIGVRQIPNITRQLTQGISAMYTAILSQAGFSNPYYSPLSPIELPDHDSDSLELAIAWLIEELRELDVYNERARNIYDSWLQASLEPGFSVNDTPRLKSWHKLSPLDQDLVSLLLQLCIDYQVGYQTVLGRAQAAGMVAVAGDVGPGEETREPEADAEDPALSNQ